MEYQVLTTADNTLFISDTFKVEGFNSEGKKLSEDIPSNKVFREMAYIHPPHFITADSFEDAKEKFMHLVKKD